VKKTLLLAAVGALGLAASGAKGATIFDSLTGSETSASLNYESNEALIFGDEVVAAGTDRLVTSADVRLVTFYEGGPYNATLSLDFYLPGASVPYATVTRSIAVPADTDLDPNFGTEFVATFSNVNVVVPTQFVYGIENPYALQPKQPQRCDHRCS
jgi:hypothetical protein